jgi:hypothetical protein
MSRLLAIGLVGHSAMHIGAVSCGLLFVAREPWLVTAAGVDAGLVDASAILVTAVVATGFVGAALAETGIAVPRSWRTPLIAVASTASAVMLAALFSLPAVPGLAIDALLLWWVLGPSLSRSAGRTAARRTCGADRRMEGRSA